MGQEILFDPKICLVQKRIGEKIIWHKKFWVRKILDPKNEWPENNMEQAEAEDVPNWGSV